MHPSTEISLINLFNKSYGSNLRCNSQLNGKSTNPPLMTLCVCVNLSKKLNVTNPLLFVNLNESISIYMYTVTIKKNNS
jgi:hypothetical protein